MRRLAFLTAALAAAACDSGADRPDAGPAAAIETTTATSAIDTSIAPAIGGEDGWNYVQRATADLNGDGTAEQAVLTARVELYRGRPAWDDGQPWQAYVETADGTRTYLYAQRLQLGTLTMRVSTADSTGASSIVLLEQLPDRMTVYEARYDSAGAAKMTVRFQRRLDPRGPAAAPQLP
jgi:hypothetical protein